MSWGDGEWGGGVWGDTSTGPTEQNALVARTYARLGPTLTEPDEAADGLLLTLVDGFVDDAKVTDSVVRDTGTTAGWQMLIDPATTPAPSWASQWFGVARMAGEGDSALRSRMLARAGWRRGRPATIEAAIASTLHPGSPVTLIERDGGDAYALRVQVFAAQCPDQTATAAAALAAKPGGITLTVDFLTGASFYQTRQAVLDATNPDTFGGRETTFPTFGDATSFIP